MATVAHGDQKRKFTGEPYITHPLRVSKKVFQASGSYQMAIAAVLHDVIEDTTVTEEQIVESFGKDVGFLVRSVTKNKALPKAEREAEYLSRFTYSTSESRVLKLADRLDNVQEMLHQSTPNDFRVKYARNTEKLLGAIYSEISLKDDQAVYGLASSIKEVFTTAVDAGIWPKEAKLNLEWWK